MLIPSQEACGFSTLLGESVFLKPRRKKKWMKWTELGWNDMFFWDFQAFLLVFHEFHHDALSLALRYFIWACLVLSRSSSASGTVERGVKIVPAEKWCFRFKDVTWIGWGSGVKPHKNLIENTWNWKKGPPVNWKTVPFLIGGFLSGRVQMESKSGWTNIETSV